jgi:putative transposase
MSVSFVARRAGVAPSQLFAWKRRMAEGGLAVVEADQDVVGASKVRELERKERLLGKKTMEVEILKETLDAARAKKTDLAARVVERGRFPMSTITKTLGVARSNLVDRQSRSTKPRGRYRKAEDADPLPLIRAKPPVNMKRVLRIMQNRGLILERHTARRPGRIHDGVIITLCSNSRWSPDHLEIHATTAKSCGCCLGLTPAPVRSSPGWRSPMPASRENWCAI